jgi:bacterioferritin
VHGDEQVVGLLNEVLMAELTAINQHFVDATMFDNWGDRRIGARCRAESIDEIKDADELMGRILSLDGHPNVQRLGTIRIGETAPETFTVALELDRKALDWLNRGIALSVDWAGNATCLGQLTHA